jgi:hypothetical protein
MNYDNHANSNSSPSFEQAVTNLLVSVTEIKGDIKLVLHQVAATEKIRDEHEKRIEMLEIQMTEALTTKKVIRYLLGVSIAILGVAIAAIGLILQIH